MADKCNLPVQQLINKIIRHKFGYLANWKKPEIVPTVGPFIPDKWGDFERELKTAIDLEAGWLSNLGHESLAKLYKSDGRPNPNYNNRAPDSVDYKTRARYIQYRRFSATSPRLSLSIPHIFAGGFGVKEMRADLEYWVRMGSWSLVEATALSIGIEPDDNLAENDQLRTTGAECYEFYSKRRKLLESHFFKYSDTASIRPKPLNVLRWMRKVQLEVPPSLHQTYNDLFTLNQPKQEDISPELEASKLLESRERTSLLRMIIGMATGGYGYKPDSERSPIPNQIRSDIAKLGLDLHQDTIRQYLKEAAAILPRELEDE